MFLVCEEGGGWGQYCFGHRLHGRFIADTNISILPLPMQPAQVLVVSACAFDSVPADLGVSWVASLFPPGYNVTSVESFLTIDTGVRKAAMVVQGGHQTRRDPFQARQAAAHLWVWGGRRAWPPRPRDDVRGGSARLRLPEGAGQDPSRAAQAVLLQGGREAGPEAGVEDRTLL